MQNNFKVGDFVSCSRLGEGSFEIIGESSHEFTLRDSKGQVANIFKVHCGRLPVPELMRLHRERIAAREAFASKIGMPKTKPGRR